jgi:hypothetical protein
MQTEVDGDMLQAPQFDGRSIGRSGKPHDELASQLPHRVHKAEFLDV